MKAFWHTKTLFIQWWKYKWSFHFDHCTQCGKCDKKHKWRWLCSSCWEKDREKSDRRKEQKYQAWHRFSIKKRIPKELQRKKKPIFTREELTVHRKEAYTKWYTEWKEAILILRKWQELKKLGIVLPEYKWKPIPFDIWPRDDKKEIYEQYKERMRKFDHIKAYIDSRKKP